jgi:hypothetical protein
MKKKYLSFSNKACHKYCEKIGAFFSALNSTHFDLALLSVVIGGMSLVAVESVLAQNSGARILEVDSSAIKDATCVVFAYLEGSFGALVMVASGVGAIISSAFGQYRASLGMMVVAIGSFVIKSLTITFFGKESVLGGKCHSDN